MPDISGDMTYNIDNGFFQLQDQNDGIYIIVYPAVNRGRNVSIDEVLNKLKQKNISNYNIEKVKEAVEEKKSIYVKIAEKKTDETVLNDININITPDKMKAYITLTSKAETELPSIAEFESALKANGVVYGIKTEVLEKLSTGIGAGEAVCVAEGLLPVNGLNGKIDFKFRINSETRPTILDDGRVDYRELNIIQNARKGDILCTVLAPTQGTPGKNTAGEDVAAKDGKPAFLPKGRNVEYTEDGLSLKAMIDGQIIYEDNKVNVFANLEIHADVDNSTGNINFIGNVIVRGNVLAGFSIEADGYVEVGGVVEGAVIKSTGNIILKRGMQGNGKGMLISGGDIIAKYIEHSTVEAKNNICAEAIMHSNVKCGNKLELSGSNGLLLGGLCRVGNEVAAKVIGSHMAIVTEVEVGVDPVQKERYKNLKNEMQVMTNDIKKAEQAIAILKKLEAAGMLTPEKREMLAKSMRTQIFYTSRIQEVKDQIDIIEQELMQDAQGKIHVKDSIHPGAKISIGSSILYVRDVIQYCTFYKDGPDIRTTPLAKSW